MQQTFGKEVRKLRIDHELRLLDLAKLVDVSVTMLSAIEIGERKPPLDFVEKLRVKLRLTEAEVSRLHELAAEQRKEVIVSVEGVDDRSRELAVAFARRFESLEKEKIEKLLKLLRQE